MSKVYHIQLKEGVFMGKLLGSRDNKNGCTIAFKNADNTKEAYTFWLKKYAAEFLPFLKEQHPKAKIISRSF